jgi:hypothetical protein
MWLIVHFKHSEHGWKTVDYRYLSFPLVKPYIFVHHKTKDMAIVANFKTKPRVGNFCKRPHKYMEFTNG